MMAFSHVAVGVVIMEIECALGISVNAFIVVVNWMDRLKGRCLNASDLILTSLGLSRVTLQWMFLLDVLFNGFSLEFVNTLEYDNLFMSLLIFLTYSNTWFLTWLSVLHCVKIANFSHPLFIHLKMKTSKVIPWLILGSALTAFMTSIPFAWTFYNVRVQNSSYDVSLNITAEASTARMHFLYLFPMLALLVALPFSMMCVSSFLLIRSLWRHTVRMECSAGSFRNPRLDAHFRAIKFVVTSLLTYLCFSVLATVNAPGIVTLDGISHEVLKCLFIFFPTLHSFVLIHANSKLSLAFQRILHHITCSKITQTSSTQHR